MEVRFVSNQVGINAEPMDLGCGWLDLLAILLDSWHVLSGRHSLFTDISQVQYPIVAVIILK